MGDKSAIEWTDATWNPVVGCSIVSPGCTNCYAMKWAHIRLDGGKSAPHYAGTTKKANGNAVWTGKVALAPDRTITAPLRWKRPRSIFVNSMGDLFHEAVPDEWIDRVFAVMALCPQHTFQLLSKRSARLRAYCSASETVERIASLVYKAKYEQGTDYSISRVAGRTGNRRQRSNLAAQEKAREATAEGRERVSEGGRLNELRSGQGGVSEPGRLPLDYSNDLRREDRDWCTPRHMDEQQRTDSIGADDQSQERHQRRQPLGELGTGDAVAAASPCNPSPECGPQSSKGQQKSEDPDYRSRRLEDAPNASFRFDGEDDSRSLRNEREGSFRDMHRKDLAAHLVWPLPNVWLGVSAEDQARADERIPDLLATPAAVRWVSAEPLLGPVDFENVGKIDSLCGFAPDPNGDRHKLDWIVAGGESGPGARPLDPAWARAIRDQCAAAGVAFFMKQMSGVRKPLPPIPDDMLIRQFPGSKT